jgi:voltage-gated potassium channel
VAVIEVGTSPVRRWGRLVAQAVGLVGCYYLLPLFDTSSTGRLWLRGCAATFFLAAALWLVIRTVAEEARADDAEVRLDRLMLAAITGVICFALIDFVIARSDETQFAGLLTKTDALYFAVTTLATVGFGDVHAQGQLARQVVTVQMVFNLVVLASAARVLIRGISQRSRTSRRSGDRSAGVVPVHGEPPDHRDVQRDDQQ